jgi:glycosyltransferase involved in cell wall biosynthesis
VVSVIVPCYNQGCFLADALDSILNQTYTNWECIIVNDGSTDNTEEVALKYRNQDARFRYIKTPNSGLSSSRNTGIKSAKGDFIQLLDSDDLIEKYKLQDAVDFLPADNCQNIIPYSSMRYFENDDIVTPQILGRESFVAHVEIKKEDSTASQKAVVYARNPFVISAPIYPITLFNTIGYFDEELGALEDWDFHIRCINASYKFHHLYSLHGKTLIRLHNSSMMRNQQLLDLNFYRLIIKHNLRKIEPPLKEPFIKKAAREITPPIFIKLLKKIIKF